MIDHLVTFGEALGVVRGRELSRASTAELGTGGAEANVAMAAARSGTPATWLGRVGDDAFGRRVVRELRAEGVTVIARIDPLAPTGLLIKELHPGARTSVSYYRRGSAGSRLDLDDVAALPLTPTTLLHVTGITPALSPEAREATLTAVDRARALGATVSFDVNHRSRLWSAEEASPVHRDLAERADILITGLDEVGLLLPRWSGGSAADAVDALGAAGHHHVIVTAGGAGVAAAEDGERESAEAVPVEVVDTVGAGDAFVGGYLAGLLRGDPLAERLRRGAVLGAAACRHPGDWEGATDLAGVGDADGDPVIR
ncbi:sugar kinase [Pseudolysinimonas sp.]|uniref:sugar kinase n=1 Tax=Pseudolysinimonas sp. TaxID=2680009 RepID=UPI003F7FBA24